VERWAIKTGIDPDARLVNQKVVVPTTIVHMRSLPAPASLPARSRVRPVETTVWAVDAILLRYKVEIDFDVHLVLSDTGGRTMIAEIPAPQCVGAPSPFLPAIRSVRRALTARFAPRSVRRALRCARVPHDLRGCGDFVEGEERQWLRKHWRFSSSAISTCPLEPGPLTSENGRGVVT
jgi:hypothetical protein